MRKFFYALMVLIISAGSAMAQKGEIQGKVVDEVGDGIPFANVAVFKDGLLETGAQTDFDGLYSISGLTPGTYDVEASYQGNKQRISGITVSSGIIFLDPISLKEGVSLDEIVIVYEAPLVDKGNTSTGGVVTKEDIQRIATRNVTSIAATKEGVYQSDEGGGLNIKGSRGDATEYIVDGVRVSGSLKLPQDAIEQLEVITGGVDPKYGDATGGFISITTRGPSKDYNGSVELASSQFLDPYGYNLATVFLTGPIITKNKGTDSASAKLGFFIAAEFEAEKDGDPSAIPNYKLLDEVSDAVTADPLRPAISGTGFNKNSEFLTFDDVEETAVRQNVAQNGLSLTSRIDYKISKTMNFQVGLTYRNFFSHDYVRTFALLNPENNPVTDQDTYRGFVRFTQRFPERQSENGESSSILGNAFYNIQFDYTKFTSNRIDEDHGMNPFNYGYIGSFDTYRAPVYLYGVDEATGLQGWYLAGYQDTLVTFDAGDLNPELAAYTQQYYDLSSTAPNSLFDIQLGSGLLNGDAYVNSTSVYSLWWNNGVPFSAYFKQNDDQYGLNFNAALDLKSNKKSANVSKHSIEFGFEFQQRIERFYQVAPIGLWTLARQLANRHILTLDTENPILVIDGQEYTYDEYLASGIDFGEFDTIFYNRLVLEEDQTWFDEQLRAKLGVGETDFINVDALPLDVLSLDLFSADELLNNGNAFVFYNGYDYLGNMLTDQPSFGDFFTEKDEFGNYTRPIGAFRPVYTAGYIQDRFNFNDIVFRVGVRVDRYDANRSVLKDKFSLYDIYDVSEVDGSQNPNGDHPENIGSDYAVYVDDATSADPTILGYRDGDTWYNANGEEVSDPRTIALSSASGVITPYLVDPEANIKDEDFDPNSSFRDYVPQISVMPRVAFSFPISKETNREALFFAHYDILTQRPPTGTSATAYDYYFFQENVNGVFDNPDLRPEKTIDYQIGFQQQLNETSVLKISAFYRELRDMIQIISVPYAYPVQYTTYGNIDFGTVKGLTVTYDLAKRTNNLKMSTSYTLQFADGTGSSSTSQLNLVGAGQPNLRAIIPLTYDSRHNIKVVLDYRFEDPNGAQPSWLDNTGLNLTMNSRSGEPYTAQDNPTPTAQFGVANRANLEGAINGSRLPWHFRADMRLDKNWALQVGKESKERSINLNAYLWVQNLFDNRNIIAVYAYSGNPTDDGYLSSALGQEALEGQVNEESFIDLYTMKMQNPSNYSIPRRIRLGIGIDF
jgi:hypothetical protein